MEPDAVRDLYDVDTATTYNERWHGDPWGNDTLHLAEAIERRLDDGVRWLDVGCGTGHFLSRFPGVERAGTDMSPSMLAEARAANDDALFFREHDFRIDVPEWHDAWSLVTCTGEPWSYLETVAETETVIENLARWTAPDGLCLLAVQDVLDLTGVQLPYEVPGGHRPDPDDPDKVLGFPGEIYIKGVVWSMTDRSHDRPRDHDDLIWPNLEHWVATFGLYFRRVVIETLPHDPPFLNTPRRVLLASGKRGPGDVEPVEVVHTRAPTCPPEEEPLPPDVATAPSSTPEAEPSDGDQSAPTSADDPTSRPEPAPARGRRPLRDVTLGDIATQTRPLDPRFWRAVARRGRSAARRLTGRRSST